MVEMVLRRHKPGSATSIEFLQRRTVMNPWPDLREILNGIAWVIVGGVATRAYMPERMTKVLDILIRLRDSKRVLQRMSEAGFEQISGLAISGYQMSAPDGTEIDVLFGDMAWLSAALKQPIMDASGYPVLDLPYLVLMKLAAIRVQDWADVSRMLGLASQEELERVRTTVARFSPEDSQDLDALIYLGKKELESPT
jgi:hypothetical protein